MKVKKIILAVVFFLFTGLQKFHFRRNFPKQHSISQIRLWIKKIKNSKKNIPEFNSVRQITLVFMIALFFYIHFFVCSLDQFVNGQILVFCMGSKTAGNAQFIFKFPVFCRNFLFEFIQNKIYFSAVNINQCNKFIPSVTVDFSVFAE